MLCQRKIFERHPVVSINWFSCSQLHNMDSVKHMRKTRKKYRHISMLKASIWVKKLRCRTINKWNCDIDQTIWQYLIIKSNTTKCYADSNAYRHQHLVEALLQKYKSHFWYYRWYPANKCINIDWKQSSSDFHICSTSYQRQKWTESTQQTFAWNSSSLWIVISRIKM